MARHHKTDTEANESRRMHKPVTLAELMCNPAARRLWMLYNAVGCAPFERAVELARAAEMFVAGSLPESPAAEAPTHTALRHADPEETVLSGTELPASPLAVGETATTPNRLALSEEQRDRLLTRLAGGAKNLELAIEFGLSLRQVQGLRIGCAREIARRRAQPDDNAAQHEQEPMPVVLVEDIVRYLRQQDDVVVPQEDGSYLVNARFRMSPSELTIRANRMRTRQRKPAFELPPGKGHPVFWHPRTSTPMSNGSREPG
jgi:hypothetical protein